MSVTNLKVIITGATGMVGEGVLLECLEHPAIEEVLVVTRKSCGYTHTKLKEIIHPGFFDLSTIEEQFKGYNACFFCAGVSSVGMKAPRYYKLTYTMTMHFAEKMAKQNPGATFCYVSGAGTDSSEQGRLMWARVKGKTENDLLKLNLDTYNFRPAMMIPKKENKNAPKAYGYLSAILKGAEKLFPKVVSNLDLVGKAMIKVSLQPQEKKVLEVSDIREISNQ